MRSGTCPGTPPPDVAPAAVCALATTRFGPACRCTLGAAGGYAIASDTAGCVCSYDNGDSINLVADTVEGACTVAPSGAWPGSAVCGFPP